MDKKIPENVLPYPLPPWRHDFRALSVFGEADEQKLRPLIPAPLSLTSNLIQLAVMRFDSTTPKTPYYDAAVIASVKYGSVSGGYWIFGFTSTDEVLSGTREIWGYRMKLADRIEIADEGGELKGFTERRGKRVLAVTIQPDDRKFEPPVMFPRIFLKLVPHATVAETDIKRVVVMEVETQRVDVNLKGAGRLEFEPSQDDPLHLLEPIKIIGATYVCGHQILPWGKELS